jgi:transglycosylase-like protein
LSRRAIVASTCAAAVVLPATAGALPESRTDKSSTVLEAVLPANRPDEDLKRTYLRLFRRVERQRVADPGRNILLQGAKTDDGDVRPATEREIERSIRVLRRMLGSTQSPSDQGGPAGGALDSIAACESHGDPAAVGGGGAYRGKYQFSYATWRSVGGTGDPAAAPEAEQDRRAAMLLARDGPGHWANCAS